MDYLRHKIFAWTTVILWMGVIFYFSHQPAHVSSEMSTGITQAISQLLDRLFPIINFSQEWLHFLIRKGAHFTVYFLLGIFVLHALIVQFSMKWRWFGIALLICFLYAISDEVHQLYIPGRSGEVRDVLLDTVGALFGIISYLFIVRILSKHKIKL